MSIWALPPVSGLPHVHGISGDATLCPFCQARSATRSLPLVTLENMYAARPTAQLAELVRSELPGYAVSLVPHPAGPAHEGGQPVRVVRVWIAEPHMDAVCWVDDDDGVEVRVIVYVAFHGAAPASLVGDSVAIVTDDLPVDDTLATIAHLIDDQLDEVCDDPFARAALDAGRVVYLNDWPG